MKKSVFPLMALMLCVAAPSVSATQVAQAKEETRTQRVEQDVKRDVGELTGRLRGDERRFADAYSRATWVHADLLAGDWDRANYDLGHIKKELGHLNKSKDVNAQVKSRIAALMPVVERLDAQIKGRDMAATRTAGEMVASFSSTATQLATMGWFARHGGGAGRGTAPQQKR